MAVPVTSGDCRPTTSRARCICTGVSLSVSPSASSAVKAFPATVPAKGQSTKRRTGMAVQRSLLMFMRLGALFQLVVGIGLWTGHLYAMVSLHQTVGVLFVLSLWIIAIVSRSEEHTSELQ